ncbi:SDR family NAD(P)-dependent oxidoreductase [Sporocytophaga myxococcoides]|uniref:SDR family NAD(P)-dependent oxidoreductase n=1 Tax=Sporocytophaga myxococcoides TaxID=153721 RepID=UPI00040A05EA|nr:SDR family NAD(P)-dependent oxidoreductase [Sporocytophaga myxococcoides]
MANFIEYVVSELKSKRLSKANAVALIKQYSLHSSTSIKAHIHPLLHDNTSDLTQQSYTSVFTGEESFLKDHVVNGQKVLPGAAYLEMIRAAVEKAMPAKQESILELHDVVWLQPLVVKHQKQVTIGLFASDEGISNGEVDFEIYSVEKDGEGNQQETIHCQGQARFVSMPESNKLDREQLKEQMLEGRIEASSIYSVYKKLGLAFGPSHQSLTFIYKGDRQLVAGLSLPASVNNTLNDYQLHPSLIDGALQTAIGLIADFNNLPSERTQSLPFALESIRVHSACTKDMFAWVRYSQGGKHDDKITKMDIDLCDQEGNVCVQLRGFSSRVISAESNNVEQGSESESIGTMLAVPVWDLAQIPGAPMKINQLVDISQHIVFINLDYIDEKKVEALAPQSSCHKFQVTQENISESYSEISLACFELIQNVLKDKSLDKAMVQIVIAEKKESLDGKVFMGLSGLLKSAAQENPRFTGQIILSDSKFTEEELVKQLQENKARPQDSIIKYTQGSRYVLRLKEIQGTQEDPSIGFKDHGVYLITGGLGGLGVLFTKEILRQSKNAKVILTGRSELSTEKLALLDKLPCDKGQVVYKQLDISNLDQVSQLISSVKKDYNQLNGIIHSAGMISDNFIIKKTAKEFNEVLSPKVIGTYNLDLATKDTDLDFMVLFSSGASITGNSGQSDYAVANGFMDQFAILRNELAAQNKRFGRTISFNWALWQEGGMGADQESQKWMQKRGMYPMSTEAGMCVFYQGLNLQYNQMLVAQGDLEQLRKNLIAEKTQPEQESSSIVRSVPNVIAANKDIKPLKEQTEEYLKKQFSGLLKLQSHKIDTQAPLEKYGIDSILAMNLTNQLEKTFGTLSKTLFFEYQTVRELAEYFIKSHSDVLNQLFRSDNVTIERIASVVSEQKTQVKAKVNSDRRINRQSGVNPPTNSKHSKKTEPIAIVGLSGRYPEAYNIEEYWQNLSNGKDCIIEVPKERWDWKEYYTEDRSKGGHHYSKWGGFIEGVDEFDPRFFNISPREAALIDPQERLFLQHSWMAMEDAGYTRASLQISEEQDLPGQVGVYVGVMYGEYQLFGAQASALGNRMGIGTSYASIANRVSYILNLHGPSMTVDTMCSSSLTAIHLACQDLNQGRTNLAIAGGVNVSIHPNKYLVISAGQFISSDGHCQSFGEGGDGYIPGEGVGVVVLKRLSEAIKDGNHIYGVIKGSTLNHGGKTNGYSVPNPQAQASMISRAMTDANVNARQISYIEAHGTGTKLGDPIEIAALSQAFQKQTNDTGFCLIGSAKSNIGHCESAAGIAGLTKVLLQMKHKQIVPSLHSKVLNPYIDFAKTPFIVNQKLKNWEQPVIDGKLQPRIAGLSSFGAGGSNAHLIIEEYVPTAEIVHQQMAEVLILLSARTEEQLKQKIKDLLKFIISKENSANQIDLVALAYTLQIGREAMVERVGFIVNSIEKLAEKLTACVNGVPEIDGFYHGQANHKKGPIALLSEDPDFQETIDKWVAHKKLAKLLDLWVNGLDLDWSKLYNEVKPQFISLPVYPFARERYWVDLLNNGKKSSTVNKSSVLHPLVHTNTSDLSQVSFSSAFTGEEFFIADHQMNTDDGSKQKVLSAAVYLEMIRTAVEQASPNNQQSSVLELSNLIWGQPFIANENKKVTVALFGDEKGQVSYDVFSHENDQEVVHCQGEAVYYQEQAPARIDIMNLVQNRGFSRLEPAGLYTFFSSLGLHYGAAYQGISSVYKGDKQLLAHLSLPASVEKNQKDFVLNPSIMEGVLQVSICLIADFQQQLRFPLLPFSLDALCITTACKNEMYAWVRYNEGNNPNDQIIKLDVDLCDKHGNVCVQMKGLSLQQIKISAPLKVNKEVVLPVNVSSSSERVKSKPQAIQLNGSDEINTITLKSIVEKPQEIKLIDSLQVNDNIADAFLSKPQGIQLNNSLGANNLEDSISGNSKLSPIELTLQPLAPSKRSDTEYTKDQIQEILISSLAEALYLKPSEIDVDKSFIDLGLDSIVGVEWIKFINKTLGLEISSTKIYDYATIKELALFLSKELENVQTPEQAEVLLPLVAEPQSEYVLEGVENLSPGNVSLEQLTPINEQGLVYNKEHIQHVLIASLAEALYLKPSEIDIDKSFIDMGLDSIVGVEWVKFINKKLGLDISSTRIYDYATIKELAIFLTKELKSVSVSTLSEM